MHGIRDTGNVDLVKYVYTVLKICTTNVYFNSLLITGQQLTLYVKSLSTVATVPDHQKQEDILALG